MTKTDRPKTDALEAEGLVKTFGRPTTHVTALDGVSLRLRRGARLGLVGPSGCGKSTLASVLSLLAAPDAGTVTLDGTPVTRFGIRAPSTLRRQVQLLWQSPRAAADPRHRLATLIGEPADLVGDDPAEAVARWAPVVGLDDELLARYPHEVSEGQLQRACIARALVCNPRYLIADEPTSMLDVSSQAQILQTIAAAQDATGLGVLLITHDRLLAEHWCDDVDDFSTLTCR